MFHWMLVVHQLRLNPIHIFLGLKKALSNAAKDQYLKYKLVGCYFHWKQAMHRHVLYLGINKYQVNHSMTKNVLDILTAIPKNEIVKKGTPHEKYAIESMALTSEDRKNGPNFGHGFQSFGYRLYHQTLEHC